MSISRQICVHENIRRRGGGFGQVCQTEWMQYGCMCVAEHGGRLLFAALQAAAAEAAASVEALRARSTVGTFIED